MQTAFTPPSTPIYFHYALLVWHQNTLHTARLLDPCFKTGWREEDFKRAGPSDWWTRRISLANQRTMQLSPNCQTKNASRAPIEALIVSSAHPSSLEAPREQSTVCTPPVKPFLLSNTLLFFAAKPSKPGNGSSSSHSVPSMQFQVLLTCLSAFFSTFLRSTFPLSVFMSYLDLAEIYQLLYAEITINVTLKEAEIWKPLPLTREFHPLCCSFPTDFQLASAPPDHSLERSIGLTSVLSPNPFPLICTFFVRHY